MSGRVQEAMPVSARTRRTRIAALAFAAALVGACYVVYGGGEHQGPGSITGGAVPGPVVAARAALPGALKAPRQILFGDLHVHTTYSADAFARSLPLLHGDGVHPPADACDFARFCSGLDFFALTDHAEALTPAHWAETKESVRQCNAAARDASSPDLVAFTGFEWTQVGRTPADHFGHKNVIYREIDEDHLPARPIAAGGAIGQAFQGANGAQVGLLTIPVREFGDRKKYMDFATFIREMRGVDACPEGADVRALPSTCRESVNTPRELFQKLDQWGFPALVIPHGTTWGFYTPSASSFARQLTNGQHDPARQRLFEVYSGHGNSEQWRPWAAALPGPDGKEICPAPTRDHEPCCHRAGELVRARCEAPGTPECEERVRLARERYLAAGAAANLTVPGATIDDWKDCGQCRDCWLPSFNYRPGGSAQVALATTDFSDPSRPKSHPLGFIASSDNHSARPGTGYKEYARRRLTEATGARDEATHERVFGGPAPPSKDSVAVEALGSKEPPWRLVDLERQASFFLTGGLVAVHAEGRGRAAIWDALQRREVYGTSGPKILLWFDLENAQGGPRPMGAEASLGEAPRFHVRAAGAFQQKPGCPASSTAALTPERLAHLCAGECENPGDRRLRIVRVEVARIRPQIAPAEPLARLVEDPWRTLPCPEGAEVCEITFEDPDFVGAGRPTTYYVRAIQEATPAVNAGNLRCERDGEGRCVRTRPCHGDYRTPFDDDCLEKTEERAWSSPIFVSRSRDAAR